jgi:prepilin-type N-terminal cleavage/methylation domain-containing protein
LFAGWEVRKFTLRRVRDPVHVHSSLSERALEEAQRLGDGPPSDGGFTLVELLLVILILAILAGTIVFAVTDLSTASATSACQANYKTVETAVEAYKAQEGSYPSAGSTFGVGASDTNAVAALLQQDGAKSPAAGPWLKDLPYSQGHYQIVVSTAGDGGVSVYTAPEPAPTTDTGTNGGSSVASCTAVS